MNGWEVVRRCDTAGVRLWREGDQIRYEAPAGALTADMRGLIARNRTSVLAALTRERIATTFLPKGVRGLIVLGHGAFFGDEEVGELLARAEAQGWPPLRLALSSPLEPGEASWRRFAAWGLDDHRATALLLLRVAQGAGCDPEWAAGRHGEPGRPAGDRPGSAGARPGTGGGGGLAVGDAERDESVAEHGADA